MVEKCRQNKENNKKTGFFVCGQAPTSHKKCSENAVGMRKQNEVKVYDKIMICNADLRNRLIDAATRDQ